MKAGDFIANLLKEVQVYKHLKYKQGYMDRVQRKAPRYPLEASVSRGDQNASRSLASDARLSTVASIATIEASQDPPIGVITEASLA